VLGIQDEALFELHSQSYGAKKSWSIGSQWLANNL